MEERAERAEDERELTFDRRIAHVAPAQVDRDARELARSRATSSIPAERSMPTTSIPAAATGTAIRPVPTPSSSTGPPERTASST